MRKRITSLLLTLVMLLSLVPAMGVTASAADVFVEVSTYEQLENEVNKGEAKVKLVANIDTTNLNGGAGVTNQTALVFFGNNNILDLNGHTLKLVSNTGTTFINVNKDLTIKDSSGTSGRIDFGYGPGIVTKTTAIHVADASTANLTVESGTLSSTKGGITLIESEGNLTINGGKFYAPYKVGSGGTYAIHTIHQYNDNAKTIITGGEIDGVVLIQRDDSAATGTPNYGDIPVQIKGGTFKQAVLLRWTEKGKPSGNPTEFSPAVEIAGGIFEKRVNSGVNGIWGEDLSTKLTGGTFKDFPNRFGLGRGGKSDHEYYSKSLGNSIIMRGNEIRTSCDWSEADWFKVYFDCFYLLSTGSESTPVTVIPNAWGMKSVTLDGDPIDYFKDWKGTVERMDNSTAHTLTFEWYPLAQKLKDAGYSYRTKCEHYISGSTAVQQTDTITADKTSHTITIKKDADPKVYSYDLQLNLQKDGSSVGIMGNEHIVKLVVNEAPPVQDTFISTVSFRLAKTDIGERGELSFEATDKNGKPVAIHPDVTWDPDKIVQGINNVSFKIPAPAGYTFSGENGKVTTLKFGGVDVIGYVDGDGALNFSFPLDVPHQHKAASVGYNARFHWDVCSCGQQIMNTGAKHTMGAWEKSKDIPGGGEEYTRSCTRAGCGYTETTISYDNVKHVTSLVLNMENYPMDGMRPHNFVHQDGDETGYDSETEQTFYKLTKRDPKIKYPSFSIATGNEKVELSATNPEAYEDRAENPDFAKWTTKDGALWLRPDTGYSDYETEFQTNGKYKAHLTLDAKGDYAFYKDFTTNQDNFKLYTDMEGITIENYGVRRWYYFSNEPSYDDPTVPKGWGWYNQAPADNSAGASRVQIVFIITAKNEGDLNITLPKLKADDDLKETWAGFDGTSNIGEDDFVKDCYNTTTQTMQWTGGPSCVIRNNSVSGESVIAQAGQTYTLTIPAVNENVLAHITIKNPEAATKVIENADGTITVTYELPAAADDKTVNGAAVSITPPAYDAAPSTTATVAGTALCTASAVTWTPADAAFEAKEYTATVTLTAEEGYTFANDAVFTINGYMADVTKNADGSVTLSYTFPALTGPHTHTYGSWVFATPDTHIHYCTANDGSYEEAPHSITSWTANTDGKTHTGTCTDCGYEKTENHSWKLVGEVAPTVNDEGTRSYECSACGATKTESIPKLIEYTVTVKDDGNGKASASPATAVAGTEITLSAKAKSGYHFKEWQVVKGGVTLANETSATTTFTMPAEDVEIEANFEKNASTGTGTGATTYPITVKSAKNGDVTASHKSASKGTTVTLTVDPDKGYVLDTLTVLDGKDKELKLTEKNGKYTFTMPDSKVTVAATFKASAPTGKNPFIDVPAGSYYEDAVIWAVGKNITTGMSATTFDPNGSCTRAQIVTFLWRAAGSPEPKAMKGFDDVASNAYYAKAVAWAVENGITTGTSASKFSPNDPCTRTQAVTFLFRYAAANGMEAVTMQELLSGYADAASVPSYAVSAMNWALAAGILQGDGVKLMPNATCTRAQIVTFIYRSVK